MKKYTIGSCPSYDSISTRSLQPESNEERPKDDEMFIDIILNPTSFSIRSFDVGGMPLFEEAGVYDPSKIQILKDIIDAKLTKNVMKLFDGLTADEIGACLRCFITDARKDLVVKFVVVLSKDDDTSDKIINYNLKQGRRMTDPLHAGDEEGIYIEVE